MKVNELGREWAVLGENIIHLKMRSGVSLGSSSSREPCRVIVSSIHLIRVRVNHFDRVIQLRQGGLEFTNKFVSRVK